jgi:4-amino-4-deoxy-L-arabinose transferase-like glycosyltransferase
MSRKNLLITAFLAIIGTALSLFLILQQDVFLWDEAYHAFFGCRIYKDLITFNIARFFFDTGQQGWSQPIHSYLNGLFFLIFGRSYFSARLSSLFCYVLLFFAVGRLSETISKEKGWQISGLANFLLVFSPLMLVLSSENMQEMAGALAITASLIYYLDNCKNGKYLNYLVFGSILSVVLLVKYHYGFLLGAAIFLTETSKIFDLKDKLTALKSWATNNLLILAGFLPLTLIWLLTPQVQIKINCLFFRVKDAEGQNWGRGLNMLQRAAYYAQSIMTSYTCSLWLGLFVIAAVIYSFRYFREIKTRSLLILFLIFFAFHVYIVATFERLIAPAMPAAFILAGSALLDIHDKYLKKLNGLFLKAAAILAVAVIAGDLIFIFPYSKEVSNYASSALAYQQNIQDIDPPFLFGLVKRPKIFLTPNPGVADYPRFTVKPVNKIDDVMGFFSSSVPKGSSVSTLMDGHEFCRYEFYWQFFDNGGPVRTDLNYALRDRAFWTSVYFLELDIDDSSPYYSQILGHSVSRWSDISRPFKQKGWLRLYSKKEFNDLGITAKIYKNTLMIAH